MPKKKSTIQEIREVSDCASWWDNKTKICVVSCRDTKTVKRQLTGEIEEVVGKKWFWASSLSMDDIDVFRFADIARYIDRFDSSAVNPTMQIDRIESCWERTRKRE